MQKIELLACTGCQKIYDQWTMVYGCKSCGGKFFKQLQPSTSRIIAWALNDLNHFFSLLKQDIWEKYHAYKERS